jgi:hypothetical protein
MRLPKKFKQQAFQLALYDNSLNEFLLLLKVVCENLNLKKVNQRTRHFKDLRFMFFCLTVKAQGFLQRFRIHAEVLQPLSKDFSRILLDITLIQKELNNAYGFVEYNNLASAASIFMQISEDYKKVHEVVLEIHSKTFHY